MKIVYEHINIRISSVLNCKISSKFPVRKKLPNLRGAYMLCLCLCGAYSGSVGRIVSLSGKMIMYHHIFRQLFGDGRWTAFLIRHEKLYNRSILTSSSVCSQLLYYHSTAEFR